MYNNLVFIIPTTKKVPTRLIKIKNIYIYIAKKLVITRITDISIIRLMPRGKSLKVTYQVKMTIEFDVSTNILKK